MEHRLLKRGYTHHVHTLYRVLHRFGMLPAAKEKKQYVVKPYQQMTHPSERIPTASTRLPMRHLCWFHPMEFLHSFFLRLYLYNDRHKPSCAQKEAVLKRPLLVTSQDSTCAFFIHLHRRTFVSCPRYSNRRRHPPEEGSDGRHQSILPYTNHPAPFGLA